MQKKYSGTPKSVPKVILTAKLYFHMLNVKWPDIFDNFWPKIFAKNGLECQINQNPSILLHTA